MIALVYPELYGVQGIARYIDSFLKNLPENHPKIYVITGDKSDVVSREYTDRIEIINIPFKKGRFSLFLWSFAARKKLLNFTSKEKLS